MDILGMLLIDNRLPGPRLADKIEALAAPEMWNCVQRWILDNATGEDGLHFVDNVRSLSEHFYESGGTSPYQFIRMRKLLSEFREALVQAQAIVSLDVDGANYDEATCRHFD